MAKTEKVRIDEAFINGVIANRKQLLKKIDKHGSSRSHQSCTEIERRAKKEMMPKAIDKTVTVWEEANEGKIVATCKIVNTAYLCAREELAY